MTRYITQQLVIGTLLVTGVLAALIWLTQSLRFIDLIINQGLSVDGFLKLTLLLLPSFLSVILPIALFAVVLFTYNRLTQDREIVVLRAAGISPIGIAKPAIFLALLVTIINLALSIHYIPQSVRDFREMQWEARNDFTKIILQEGAFTQISDGMTVYVRERSADDELLGILVHDTRRADKTITWMAERGALIHTDNGPRVLMVNGNSQELRRGNHQLNLLYFDSYTLDFGISTKEEQQRFRDARERTMSELFYTQRDNILSDIDIRRFRVEGHKRLVMPLSTLGFTLIALAVLLNGQFARRGMGVRVMIAIALMVLMQAAQLGASNLAANDVRMVSILYVVTLVPTFIAGYVLIRPPKLRIQSSRNTPRPPQQQHLGRRTAK